MPICVKCGMKIPVGRYCGGCGIRVAESASHSGEQPSLNSGNDLNSPPKPESVEEEINRLTADLKLFPSSIDTYLKLSEALLIAGKLDRAFSTIRAFKALFPDDPRGHKIAGKILETLDRKEEAIKSFEKSLEKDSSDIQTVLHVVELLHGIGRTREALSKLQPLRHFSQKHPIILLKMAEIEVSQGNPSIAREYLSEFRKYAGETLEMFALLGRTMILQSFFDGAVRLFQEGLSRFPNDPELHLGLGKSFIGLNQREKAVVELENALRNSPGNPEILLEIGRLHGIMGLYEKSEEMFSRIRNNPATLGAIFLELGKFYLSQTMRDQAIIELKHARELSPHHPEISRILGETLETAQENSQALGIYDSF
ncbi:tetratricopeptide repeat protein, partial [bacterium]|nr:tetratricopeptide repeat protein [bacterium]